MKKIFKKKENVIGYLDKITKNSITGWAINYKNTPLTLHIRIKGQIYLLETQWLHRLDIIENYGDQFQEAGFFSHLSEEIQNKLKLSEIDVNEICILANGVELIMGCKEIEEPKQSAEEIIEIESRAIGHIEKITTNSIEGWAIHQQNLMLEIKIQIADTSFKLSPKWGSRQDISEHYGKEFETAGFICELPEAIKNKLKEPEIDIDVVSILANGFELIMDCKAIDESIQPVEKIIEIENIAIGHIEKISTNLVEGWAIHRQNGHLELAIEIESKAFLLTPKWNNRVDISNHYGAEFKQAGFSCQLPPEVQNKIKFSTVNITDIRILANGTALILDTHIIQSIEEEYDVIESFELVQTKKTLQQEIIEPLNPESDNKLQSYIKSWGHFLILGQLNKPKDKAKNTDLKLICNGKELECSIVLELSKQQNLNESIEKSENFQIELPGYIWESGEDILEIEIQFQSEKLLTKPLVLTKKKAINWLEGISNISENEEKQYMALLALEHLRYSKLINNLSLNSQKFFHSFSEKMKLDEFMDYDEMPISSVKNTETQGINSENHILWAAQRDLNERLKTEPSDIYPHIVASQKALKLSGKVLNAYWRSIIPLLCKNDELLKLREQTAFSIFYPLENSKNNWESSLACAALMADQEITRATTALWAVGQQLNPSDWLNTECINFSIKQCFLLEAEGKIKLKSAEEFRYAFLGLLDSFKGEWFSRLHDLQLIEAVVYCLDNIEVCTDHQQQDIIRSSIKHYGLNPVFWRHIEEKNLNLKSSLFSQAKMEWHQLNALFTDISLLNTKQLSITKSALEFFTRAENPEAEMFLREIVIHTLAIEDLAETPETEALIGMLIDSNAMEAIRLAANPIVNNNSSEKIVKKYQTAIYNNLRVNTEREHSEVYQAQKNAATMIKDLCIDFIDKDKAFIGQELEQFYKIFVPLNTWEGNFLGIDILVTLLAKIEQKADDISIYQYLMHLDSVIQEVIAESKSNYYLVAPVCAAIANINENTKSALIKDWLDKILVLINIKFNNLPQQLFAKSGIKSTLTNSYYPQDTLVVIYSCKAYLSSRVQAIRNTWIKDLKKRNIPYVILVGDGNDKIDGDVLALDVSDTYEDLPLKSLKLFDWAYKNTNAQYVLKIDDDCFLDVDEYFDSLSYRKHHYYGRVIHRSIGTMDRTWHHEKSKAGRAKKVIDKSPEPALYTDGGGGYCLSRLAMHLLNDNALSSTGKRLIANSFMEDKLVGDLLAISHILPSNEDYECYQRRRTFAQAIPVGMWENIFFPSNITPTKVTHLDTDKDQEWVEQNKAKSALWPKKIWPSCWNTNIHLNSNQLELVTLLNKANILLKENLFVIAVMRNEITMLPHFLEHYRNMGVKAFIIADNCSDDGTREYLLNQLDVVLYSSDTEYKYSHFGVAWQQAILANHCVGKWTLIADADELLVYPELNISLLEFVKKIEQSGADCIRTDMIDMYPYGDLKEADFTKGKPFELANWHDKESLKEWRLGSGFYSNSKNWASGLRHRLDTNAEPNAFVSQKYALIKYKPWMRFSQGIHYASNVNVAEKSALLMHFKYHAGFKEKIEEEVRRKQHYGDAKEYQRYAGILAESEGGFGSESKSVKVKLEDFDEL